MLKIGITILCTLCAVMLVQFGMAWINEGQGLHPLIAFPLATIIFLAPIMAQLFANLSRQIPDGEIKCHTNNIEFL